MKPRFEIRDYMNIEANPIKDNAIDLFHDVCDSERKPVLRASIDATHSGRLTNMRVYPGKRMRKSASTFLKPSPKPVLKHHNDTADAIGRVSKAQYVKLKNGDAFDFDYKKPSTGAGSGFIKLDVDIMDADAIEQFMDGRISQFSSRQHFQDVYCSICGENIADQLAFGGMFNSHEHQVGETYKIGKGRNAKDHLTYLITGDLEYKEVSAVNIPGDDETKVNGFEIIEPQAATDWAVMNCQGDQISMDSLTLSVGGEFVDLLSGGSVTSEDRKRLTGKTHVAVSASFTDHLANEDSKMDDNQKPEDDTEVKDQDKDNKNTSDSVASGAEGKDSNVEGDGEAKEGVEAPKPDASSSDSTSDNSSLSSEALQASVEALTKELKEAKTQRQEAEGKASRLEAQLSEKDSDIERQKTAAADSLKEAKTAYATQLLNNRMFLKKSDVSSVDSKESYEEALNKYQERSLDSLKDALSDLGPEVSEFQKSAGVKGAADFAKDKKVEAPVANTPVEGKDKQEPAPSKPKTAREQLDNYIA